MLYVIVIHVTTVCSPVRGDNTQALALLIVQYLVLKLAFCGRGWGILKLYGLTTGIATSLFGDTLSHQFARGGDEFLYHIFTCQTNEKRK